MARMTLLIGLVLVVMGILQYEVTNHASAALIPAAFGIILGVLGVTARTEKEKIRMIVMHIAVTVGLVGFLMTAGSIWTYVQMLRGIYTYTPNTAMVKDRATMSVVLLFYVLLCVRSFISARKAREAAPETRVVGSR